MKRKKGYYSISVVAKMFSVHQQTIRMYEKEGLISPKRSEGNTRLFSEEDVDRLEEVINLTHKMGVNLAGVEIILKLQKKISRLQSDMNKLFEQLHGQLNEQTEEHKQAIKNSASRLLDMKEEGARNRIKGEKGQRESKEKSRKPFDVEIERDNIQNKSEKASGAKNNLDDWEIEYEVED